MVDVKKHSIMDCNIKLFALFRLALYTPTQIPGCYILNECDLSSAKKIDRCVAVANQLLEIIDTNLPIGKINNSNYLDY